MKQPITYYGGKQQMLRHLLPLVPDHTLYCEPFAGGATLFWNKAPVKVEVLNDTNFELINFYEVVKRQFSELNELVQATAHSRAHHQFAKMIYESPEHFDRVRRAWAVYVLANQSYSSIIGSSWGYERKSNKTTLKILNKKAQFVFALAERIEQTQLECRDAVRVIESRDTSEAFFYVDPPYPQTHCGHYKDYSMADFKRLLNCLSAIDGKFLLSSYGYPELTEEAQRHGWHQQTFEKRLSASSVKGRKKVEVLTANYSIS